MNKWAWAMSHQEVVDWRLMETCPNCGEGTVNPSTCSVCGFDIAGYQEAENKKEAERYLKLEAEWAQ